MKTCSVILYGEIDTVCYGTKQNRQCTVLGKVCNFLILNLEVHIATTGPSFKLLNAVFPRLYDR